MALSSSIPVTVYPMHVSRYAYLRTLTGGPDISGIQSLSESSELLLGLSGGLYDIVSWDIRGTGSLSMYAPTPGSAALL